MNLQDAQAMIGQLMREHGLLDRGWTQAFDNSVKRFGCCSHGNHRLSFSRYLVGLNGEDEVRDTALHEIAHALVGPGHGHDWTWKAKAREIGARPDRCYSAEQVTTVPPRWIGTCPACGKESTRERLTQAARRSSCGRCSGGRYNARFALVWRSNDALDVAARLVVS